MMRLRSITMHLIDSIVFFPRNFDIHMRDLCLIAHVTVVPIFPDGN